MGFILSPTSYLLSKSQRVCSLYIYTHTLISGRDSRVGIRDGYFQEPNY
jgi:hypothetical protein